MAKPIIAIVGRPNVGKSTLFNRIVGERISIVEDSPGITRDRIYSDAEWLNTNFTLIDTGGLEVSETDDILINVQRQAEIAIQEADVILFVVDGREGVTGTDREIANFLRKTQKPVILVANKMENRFSIEYLSELYELGFNEPVPISSEHGLGIGDLLDLVIEKIPSIKEEDYDEGVIKVALIGKPNVGKSSIVNTLLGQERVIVSETPGTTRDAIDTSFTMGEQNFVLIDTAGLRRKAKIFEAVEKYSVIRTLKAIERSDVVLMVIDAAEGVTSQDKKIAGYADEAGKACVIVVNKWDLVKKDNNTFQQYTETIRKELEFLKYAPIIFVSAKTAQRITKIMDYVLSVAEEHAKRIGTGDLNDLIQEAIMLHQPPTDRGKRLKIFYCTQSSVKPPTFIFFVNEPELMHFSYLRYLENTIREAYGFNGTPIRLLVRKRGK
jgi:GTP-binding protein